MFTVTADLILPSTVTGSWPRPRWFDVSLWGRPLDTSMLDVYKDKRQVIWDMAEAMNKELIALRDAGCRCIQVEEPTLHFMANTFGKDDEQVKFMIEAFNREVEGLDDVEVWIHTCWGNPNMQRVMEDTS